MSAPPTDRLARLLGAVLKWGALASTALLAFGLVLQLLRADSQLADALMHAGLIVLMATPVARVAVSVADYAAERDWLFLGLTASVLVILLGSLLVAMG